MIRTVGSRALIVDLPDLETVMNWHAALSAEPLPRQTDVVAAARTVLVTFDSPQAARDAFAALESFSPGALAQKDPREITIDVLYDGEDLDDVAAYLSMSRDALIEWHTSTTWVAAFGGFAPGFAYCVAEDDNRAKSIPRRSTPRTEVPAGSVGLAGEFSAVYPRSSPGGWQLLGRTTDPMWDSAATPPARVAPGDRVTYRAVQSLSESSISEHIEVRTEPRRPVLNVEDAGLQTLFQDLGRPGKGNLGVTTSGAADRAAAFIANEAVGNPRHATVLENVGGLTLTALTETVVSVTGALAKVEVNGAQVPLAKPVIVPAKASLTVQNPRLGMRSYVAVRGGFVAKQELGSSSADLLSGLGPAPLTAGDVLAASLERPATTNSLLNNPLRVSKKGASTTGTVRVIPGPREDWFGENIDTLFDTPWEVTASSNRVGLRLEGAEVHRVTEGELPSEGIVAGSIQVPPNGKPVLFLRDHAVTGGYPVIGTVLYDDLDIAAQLPPGSTITFERYNEGN